MALMGATDARRRGWLDVLRELLPACSCGSHLGAVQSRGSVDLTGSRKLVTVGAADVRGELVLAKCERLRQLAPGLRCHTLDVSLCPLLETLPPLDLAGELRAFQSGLRELPRGLRVGGDADLSWCTSLTDLGDVEVGGDLNLEHCKSLESLPATMLLWPPRDNGEPHKVFLGGSGLSRETVAWLARCDAPGVRFYVSMVDAKSDGSDVRTASLAEELERWPGGPHALPALDEPNARELHEFLVRLRGAKEFGVSESRPALAERVRGMLHVLRQEDAAAREGVLQRVADALDACDDKPVWALNQISLVAEAARARGDRDQLRALGKRVMRLMVVHEHVEKKIRSLGVVDDVCVYLRFEIALREELDLPVAATDMLFPNFMKITPEELAAAKEAALGISDAEFAAWLEQWPEWQRQARRELVQELDWAALPAVQRSGSAVGELETLTGDPMGDPVAIGKRGAVWSLAELARHWEATGLDLHNAPLSAEALRSAYRVVSSPDGLE